MNEIVFCAGTVDQTTVSLASGTAYVATCSQSWQTMAAPQSTPLDAEVWSDESGHLVRLTIPAQGLDVVREDIASVAARRVTISRPNDEQVKILANGFSLAATASKRAG